jgi:hypothetical protein
MNITQSTIAKINAKIALKAEELINDEPMAMDEKQNFKDLFHASKKITEHLKEKNELVQYLSDLLQEKPIRYDKDFGHCTDIAEKD